MRLSLVLAQAVCLGLSFLPAVVDAKPAPCATSFELYDLDDKLFSLNKVLGDPDSRLVVVDFFSMSCAPCKRAMPRLSELQLKYAADGLRVVVVALPAGSDRTSELDRIRAFFEPLEKTFPVVFDKYSVVSRQYGVSDGMDAHLPQSFVIGPDGKILHRFDNMDSVIAAIESTFGEVSAKP